MTLFTVYQRVVFAICFPSLTVTICAGLPLELYSLWHQYPWQLGDLMCRMKTLVLEGTANASVLTLGKSNLV